ncbi:MAG: hypothetical protein IJI75_03280 [Solobacterium sp.]|nr:hypothetical protein [Solobacterium sp.]
MLSPDEFYKKYNGKAYAESASLGVQCVYGFKLWCLECLGYCYPTKTNWAAGYWTYRHEHAAEFSFITDTSKFQDGDWVIWSIDPTRANCPQSHISMFYKGQFFGQRQGTANREFCLKAISYNGILGALRWKGYEHDMFTIEANKKYQTAYKGQNIIVFGQPEGTELGLLSAHEDGKKPEVSVQLVPDMDRDDIVIYGKINCSFFIMSSGQHLGIRVGFGEEWEIPRQNAFWWFTELKDGSTDVGLDVQWPYGKDAVKTAFSPALITFRHGKRVWYESPATAGRKNTPVTQSALLRTKDRYAFCMCTGKLTAADFTTWAINSINGLQDVILLDSGGSSTMQVGYETIYATNEKRKVANCLIFYKKKDGSELEKPDDETAKIADLEAKLAALNTELNSYKDLITETKESLKQAVTALEKGI